MNIAARAGAKEVLLADETLAGRIKALADEGVDHVIEVAFGANIKTDVEVLAQGGSIASYATDACRLCPALARQWGTAMHPILRKLEGADRRSIGRSNEVVADVIADPALFNVVFPVFYPGPTAAKAGGRCRRKISALHPEYLAPHKATLIERVARLD